MLKQMWIRKHGREVEKKLRAGKRNCVLEKEEEEEEEEVEAVEEVHGGWEGERQAPTPPSPNGPRDQCPKR